jgi:hypothetical protein
MSDMHKKSPINKRDLARKTDHLTVPPRLDSEVKNAKMLPIKKKKRSS